MNSRTDQYSRCARPGQFDRVSLAVRGLIVAVLLSAIVTELNATNAPAPPPSSEFQPRLNLSAYQPVTARDPFLKPGANGSPVSLKMADSTIFHLDGLLGSTNDLTAIVNGWAISLNKPVVLETASGRIQIKAVKISFEGVILEVGGKRVELKRFTENLPLQSSR